MITLSIIVPVYNTAPYLVQCLDSLIHQTLHDKEIILVDDGSTDESLTILKAYQANYPNIITLITQTNQGQAIARNRGLELAKGKFIGFVDSDDWVEIDMYEKMVTLSEVEMSDIVICDMIDHYPSYDVYHHSSSFSSKFTVTPSACNKLFRASSLDGARFPVGLWYEDFEFTTINLFKTEKISVIHEGLYHCHAREESTMFNHNSLKNLDMIEVFKHIKDFLVSTKMFDKNKNTYNYLIVDHILITTINRVANQKNPNKNQVIKQFRQFAKDNQVSIAQAKKEFNVSFNRVLVAYLNYYGLHYISKMLLSVSLWVKG